MNVVTSLVFHDTSRRLIFTSVLSRWSFFFWEQWVQMDGIVFMYLIHRWRVVVRSEWPRSICVRVCAHLHLCICVALGANDSWHLATISGSLISIERFGGEAQIPLYLTNRCVFDPLTQLTNAHRHTLRCTHWPSIATAWHMEMSISKSHSAQGYWQQWI